MWLQETANFIVDGVLRDVLEILKHSGYDARVHHTIRRVSYYTKSLKPMLTVGVQIPRPVS